METPEAKAKSAELHRIMLEEKKLKNPSAGDDDDEDDEGEADENEEGSSGDDENHVSLRSRTCLSDCCFMFYLAYMFLVLSLKNIG